MEAGTLSSSPRSSTPNHYERELIMSKDTARIEQNESSAPTTTYEQQAERIAALCRDFNNPAHVEAYYEFCDALDSFKAGRVWTPERVRKLYPIMKESRTR